MRFAAIVIFVVEVDALHWQETCISELEPRIGNGIFGTL